MGEKRCQAEGCRNRVAYTVSILMDGREMVPCVEVRLCSKHFDAFQHKPLPEGEKRCPKCGSEMIHWTKGQTRNSKGELVWTECDFFECPKCD